MKKTKTIDDRNIYFGVLIEEMRVLIIKENKNIWGDNKKHPKTG